MLKKNLFMSGCLIVLTASAATGHTTTLPSPSKKKQPSTNTYKHHVPQHPKVRQAQSGTDTQDAGPVATHDLMRHGQAQWQGRIRIPQIKKVKINGFLSTGFSKLDRDGARYGIPNYGTVQHDLSTAPLSLIGLQFSTNLTDKLNAVVQLVASGNTRDGHNQYDVRAEWGFLRYAINPHVHLRAGRFRLPIFLYSDTAQVGYAFPWVTPPNEVYRLVPFFNFNAVDATFAASMGDSDWTFEAQPFFGAERFKFELYNTQYNQTPMNNGQLPVNTLRFDANNIVGGVLSLTNPVITLRASILNTKVSSRALNPTNPTVIPAGVPVDPNTGIIESDQNVMVYDLAARLNTQRFLLLGEYAYRRAFTGVASLTGYYGTAGLRLGDWLPNFTYAHLTTTHTGELTAPGGIPDARLDPFAESLQAQESETYGLDYYFNSAVVFKLAAARVTPLAVNGVATNGLFDLNVAGPIWMYSVGLSAIF